MSAPIYHGFGNGENRFPLSCKSVGVSLQLTLAKFIQNSNNDLLYLLTHKETPSKLHIFVKVSVLKCRKTELHKY